MNVMIVRQNAYQTRTSNRVPGAAEKNPILIKRNKP